MNAAQTTVAPAPEVREALPPPEEPEAPFFAGQLSDGQVNTIYTAAYHLSRKGQHEQASTLFALLGMYRPLDPTYSNAVAICFRKMGRYEDAIRLFARTMELRPSDYGPAFHLIECLALLGRQVEAIDLLATITGVARADGDLATLQRAGGMLELLRAPGQ